MCCYILCGCALLKSNLEHVELTGHEFLLTHNLIKCEGDLCSFRAMDALATLEHLYRKVNDFNKFFFMLG